MLTPQQKADLIRQRDEQAEYYKDNLRKCRDEVFQFLEQADERTIDLFINKLDEGEAIAFERAEKATDDCDWGSYAAAMTVVLGISEIKKSMLDWSVSTFRQPDLPTGSNN